MKKGKSITTFILAGILFFAACKSKQTAVVVNPAPAPVADLLTVAKTKYPSITQADLDEGKKIFTVDCVKCHGAKKITSRSEEKWTDVMNWMAPKANLDEAQKLKVLQYVLSARSQELQSSPK